MMTLAATVVPTLAEDDFVGESPSAAGLARLAEFWKGSLAALIFLGYALGTCISGRLGDCWGRRPTILLAYGCMVAVNIYAAMITMAIPTLSVLRFLTGLVCGLGAPPSMALLSESIPTPQRSRIMCLQGVFYVFGEMFCCLGLMFFMPRLQPSKWWLVMTVWVSVPPVVLLVVSFPFLHESKRWLQCEESQKSQGLWMHSREFWMTSVPLAIALLAGNMSTLGLSYVWPDLFRDVGGHNWPAVRLLVMKSMGIPALFFAWLLISWNAVGHRMSLLLVSIPLAVFTVMALETPTESLRCLIFGILSTTAATVSYTVLCIFTTEAFPTEIRTGAVGLCFALGRLGAIASPPIYEILGKTYYAITLSVAVLAGGLSLQAVPLETKGVDLRDWLESNK